MKNILAILALCTAAAADDLYRFEQGFLRDGRYVDAFDHQLFWDGGAATKLGDLWVGDGWETFPGGQGALTTIMLEPEPEPACLPEPAPVVWMLEPGGSYTEGVWFPGNVYRR